MIILTFRQSDSEPPVSTQNRTTTTETPAATRTATTTAPSAQSAVQLSDLQNILSHMETTCKIQLLQSMLSVQSNAQFWICQQRL